MPSSLNSHTSNEENSEPHTPITLPYPDGEPMDRSSDEEPVEETSEEEEPSETDPDSPRPISPIEESQRIPPFTILRQNPGAPWTTRGPRPRRTSRMSIRGVQSISLTAPSDDPYRPPSPPTNHGWWWISATLDRWRRKYGNPFIDVAESATQFETPACPVTREPPHLTIPLLIMRMDDQENDINLLKDEMEAVPSADDIQEIQADMEYHGRLIQELRVELEQLKISFARVPKPNICLEEKVMEVEPEMGRLRAKTQAQDQSIASIWSHLRKIGY